MKPHFLLGSLDIKTGLFDEDPTPRSSRRESSRRCNTIYIPSDDSISPTVLMSLYSSPGRQIKDAVPHISGNSETNNFKPQLAKRQPQQLLARSTWRAPLQQSLKVPQAGASTVDVPGTGGGKENKPPGISVNIISKSKLGNHAQVSKIACPVVQNATPRRRITTKPKEVQKEPVTRVALGKTQGNVDRVPKKIEYSPPIDNAWALALKRAFSAIIIQRVWRSFKERQNKHACDIATARVELAYEVITRWWSGVKACKLREQTEQVKLKERTEQTTRRKSAGQRPYVRQSQQNAGRRGIRRL